MTARSTRTKMRHQAKKSAECIKRSLNHLKYLEELADGNSDVVKENLPGVVAVLDGCHDLILKFREKL